MIATDLQKVVEDAARKYAIDDVTAAPVGETGGDS